MNRLLAAYAAGATALLLAVAVFAGLRIAARVTPAPAHRAPPTALEARAAQIHGAVVFLGDSRVALLATSNIADRSENFGVSGQTLSGLDAELRGVDLSGASAIVIEAGVNDWFSSRTGFRARYAAALAALPLSRPVIAAAILPVDGDEVWRVYDGDYDFRGANAYVARWNREIESLCAARPHCTFVPTPAALLKGRSINSAYTLDGVHLNAAGAAIWDATLRQALSRSGTTPRPSPST